MGLRERVGGEWQWTLNLAVHGAGDVLLSLLERLRCGYGRILGRVRGIFCVIPNLKWQMASRLDFGIISGVECGPKGDISRFIWCCLCKECLCYDSLGVLWWFQ